MKKSLRALTVAVLALPLSGSVAHGMNAGAASPMGSARLRLECYSVLFSFLADRRVPGEVAAQLSGDLVGTVTLVFRPEDFVKFVGTTVSNGGIAYWSITGGIVPGPLSFTTEFNNRNHVVDRPGSPADVFENTGKHRVVEGVRTANFQYSGTAVRLGLVEHEYHGVLCI